MEALPVARCAAVSMSAAKTASGSNSSPSAAATAAASQISVYAAARTSGSDAITPIVEPRRAVMGFIVIFTNSFSHIR